MAQNITLMGAVYLDTPSVRLPKDGGGYATFTDVTGTTATESDVASGKVFFKADGSQATGTASGGGGGLVYESGTVTPTEDALSLSVTFASAHINRPFYLSIADIGDTIASTDSILYFTCTSIYDGFDGTIQAKTGASIYSVIGGLTKSSTNVSNAYSVKASETAVNDVMSASGFTASISQSKYFRANRTYKWIAVWKPTI